VSADYSFAEILAARTDAGRHVCVGLDTDLARLPSDFHPGGSDETRITAYNEVIIDATCDLVAAYKPNVAFYEALGASGFEALASTIAHIARTAPDVPVILDAKRGDIGSTNEGYATAAFDELGAHAITVHPYLGGEALAPFLSRADRGVFVLARTSNPGAGELQDLLVDGMPLYQHVARRVATTWNTAGNCGLVVGATYPGEMAAVRAEVGPELPILIPGVGAQGGDLATVVAVNVAVSSRAFVINASRSVIYAPAKDGDVGAAARAEVERMNGAIALAAG
jgi:orotidine-5'-phosphate decarboxylase